MAAASYPSGLREHATFNVPHLSGIPGNLDAPAVPLTNPTFAPGDSRLPVIGKLFGALIDVPPNAWLFV
jgi:hypothetical protein